MIVYSNGRFHQLEEPAAALGNSGLLHGYGVFTTLRLAAGRPVDLVSHHARLAANGRALGLELPFDAQELLQVVSELTEANQLQGREMRLRLTLTKEDGRPFLTAVPGPLPDPLPAWQRYGAGVITLGPAHQRTILPRLKTINYLASLLALETAAASGCAEALILDGAGRLLEGAVSNVFLVRQGALATPTDDGSILPGITRKRVAFLGREQGLEVRETTLTAAEVARAEEIFLTNCVRSIVPVVAVDGRTVADGLPGPVTRSLQQALLGAESRS